LNILILKSIINTLFYIFLKIKQELNRRNKNLKLKQMMKKPNRKESVLLCKNYERENFQI